MKVFFATSNAAKLTSVARVLGADGIEVERLDIELPELQGEDAKEIAEGKVRAAFTATNGASVMVMDSALHIRALRGFPGTNVKWATKQIGVTGYLDLLARHVSPASRECVFVDVLAYLDRRMDAPRFFIREEQGSIATAERGTMSAAHKSPVATVFVPRGETKTLAEMSPEEFSAYRSRPEMERHYKAFAEWLSGRSA